MLLLEKGELAMDERTLEKNEAIQKMLKSEYDLAKRECEFT